MTYDNVPHIGARIKPEQQKVLYLDVVLSKCVGDSYNISSKIVETLSSCGKTLENKTIHTPPPPIHSKKRCLLFLIGSL